MIFDITSAGVGFLCGWIVNVLLLIYIAHEHKQTREKYDKLVENMKEYIEGEDGRRAIDREDKKAA